MEIKKIELTDENVEKLIELSGVWVDENISFGMRKNTREDIKEPVFAAYDGDTIVGYAFGHFYEQEKYQSYADKGTKCFDVDEIYVLPEYRSQGAGKALFSALEEYVKGKASFITLVTSTKDYKKILKFYAENNGMEFHDAFLIKNIE